MGQWANERAPRTNGHRKGSENKWLLKAVEDPAGRLSLPLWTPTEIHQAGLSQIAAAAQTMRGSCLIALAIGETHAWSIHAEPEATCEARVSRR